MNPEDLRLSSFGISQERGFLPDSDPLIFLQHGLEFLDYFGNQLPELIDSKNILAEAKYLPIPHDEYFKALDLKQLQLAWVRYCFIQSAYVHSQTATPISICRNIAQPMWAISKLLNKPPILSYDAYTLNNWKRKDKNGPIAVDNLELIQTFIRDFDQAWFILIHVDIENEAGLAIRNLKEAIVASDMEDLFTLDSALAGINKSLENIINTMRRMPEGTSPDTYYKIRPWIMSFQDVVYEGVADLESKPQSFRGQTGAQTSIFQSLEAGLQMPKLEINELAKHLLDMRNYMPEGHRRFIMKVEEVSQVRKCSAFSRSISEKYNGCVDKICDFLEIHFNYAVTYIHNKTPNPKGTGGTDFMRYLKGRLDERRQNAYIKN